MIKVVWGKVTVRKVGVNSKSILGVGEPYYSLMTKRGVGEGYCQKSRGK